MVTHDFAYAVVACVASNALEMQATCTPDNSAHTRAGQRWSGIRRVQTGMAPTDGTINAATTHNCSLGCSTAVTSAV